MAVKYMKKLRILQWLVLTVLLYSYVVVVGQGEEENMESANESNLTISSICPFFDFRNDCCSLPANCFTCTYKDRNNCSYGENVELTCLPTIDTCTVSMEGK